MGPEGRAQTLESQLPCGEPLGEVTECNAPECVHKIVGGGGQHESTQRLPFRRNARLKDGGGNSIPATSSPLLTHLAAKGLPVGKKPHSSVTDSFAQVLRESLEQPHLCPTKQREQRQQHLQEGPCVQESQRSSPRYPSPFSQHRAHAACAPPPEDHSAEFFHDLACQPSLAPTPAMPSPTAAARTHAQQTAAEEAEEVGYCSGDESDDEGSSSSSSSSSTASSNDSVSFCSCSSSLEQDIDSSLSPFQDIDSSPSPFQTWAPHSLDKECSGHPQHPAGPLHRQSHLSAADAKHPDIAGVADKMAPGGRRSLHQHHQHHHPHHHHQHHHHHHLHSHDEMHPAVEAFLQDSLAFAFSGGGFFFPYSLGCVIQLADLGLLTDRTPLAGASCGAIIVACVNAGLDLHGLVPQLLEFAADCRTFGTAGRLRSVIEKFMRRALPPDAHLRCSGTCFLSLTKVFPYLKTCVVSDYTSKEDLVQAIATSCHIPAYNDGSFVKEFRGQYFVDGGLIRHIPALPLDHPASYVAGVSCVPFKFLENLPGVQRLRLLRSLSVSPDMFDTFPFAWSEIGGLVLAPAEDPVLLQMVDMGKRDIMQWVASVGLGPYVTGPKYNTKAFPRPPTHPSFAPHPPIPLSPSPLSTSSNPPQSPLWLLRVTRIGQQGLMAMALQLQQQRPRGCCTCAPAAAVRGMGVTAAQHPARTFTSTSLRVSCMV
ncbi:hypothetical protein DUNSADRAFT_10890 [Dunaliella salina]|uniref:Patatin n=1 Tax=Dunaliella salina TaxID=3046 RepID=A0ABQ7H4Q6_DUNSA|nr:hypothetical protein DUNSADRAFT_10890 [Dunaliella salina]|eukprot:KAF5841827.1 hypothetical protein DUNSADRAFT_10890 [Dunaliella salina]